MKLWASSLPAPPYFLEIECSEVLTCFLPLWPASIAHSLYFSLVLLYSVYARTKGNLYMYTHW